MTGTADRQLEARQAARAFLPGVDLSVDLHDLPDGHVPSAWSQVKDILDATAESFQPDVIIAPSRLDAHQDHRTIGEIVPRVFRDALYLAYEIPKWDGDMPRPSVYFPLSMERTYRKVELLNKCFPSQQYRDWWDDEVFLGLARSAAWNARPRMPRRLPAPRWSSRRRRLERRPDGRPIDEGSVRQVVKARRLSPGTTMGGLEGLGCTGFAPPPGWPSCRWTARRLSPDVEGQDGRVGQ